MKRRTFMGAVGTAGAMSTFPAPAIAKGVQELKLVSSYPPDPLEEQVARVITESSGGRLNVKYFPADELVGAFEVFDAVAEGVADMYLSAEHYWHDRSPAYSFFATVPFGLTAAEMTTWIYEGGGQQLWDELSASFNIKPFLLYLTSVQMGGWYAKEINSLDDFKGMRIRMPEPGAEVLRRLGATAVLLPAGEIVPALNSGALDAAEFAGPYLDLMVGLHTTAAFYYYPGFHEPGLAISLGVNARLWDSLTAEDQSLITLATAAQNSRIFASTQAAHIRDLGILLEQHGAKLRKFDDDILRVFGKLSGEVVAELGASDPFTRRVYDSYMKFRKASQRWLDISDRAYLNARSLGFNYGG